MTVNIQIIVEYFPPCVADGAFLNERVHVRVLKGEPEVKKAEFTIYITAACPLGNLLATAIAAGIPSGFVDDHLDLELCGIVNSEIRRCLGDYDDETGNDRMLQNCLLPPYGRRRIKTISTK